MKLSIKRRVSGLCCAQLQSPRYQTKGRKQCGMKHVLLLDKVA